MIDYFKYNRSTGGPLIVLSYIPPIPPTPTPIPQSSETIYLDTRNISVKSKIVLLYGRPYRITMSGTYSHYVAEHWIRYGLCWGKSELKPFFPSPDVTNGQVGADPEYRFAHPNYSGGCSNGKLFTPNDGVSWIVFSLDNGGDFPNPDPISKGYREDHTYVYSIFGRGFPLIVRLNDDPYEDNYGQIKINIDPQ